MHITIRCEFLGYSGFDPSQLRKITRGTIHRIKRPEIDNYVQLWADPDRGYFYAVNHQPSMQHRLLKMTAQSLVDHRASLANVTQHSRKQPQFAG